MKCSVIKVILISVKLEETCFSCFLQNVCILSVLYKLFHTKDI